MFYTIAGLSFRCQFNNMYYCPPVYYKSYFNISLDNTHEEAFKEINNYIFLSFGYSYFIIIWYTSWCFSYLYICIFNHFIPIRCCKRLFKPFIRATICFCGMPKIIRLSVKIVWNYTLDTFWNSFDVWFFVTDLAKESRGFYRKRNKREFLVW